MSTDFQDRLSRIESIHAGGSRSTPEAVQSKAAPNMAVVGAGGACVGGAIHLIRKLNEHYETFKADYGLEWVIIGAILGSVLLLWGTVLIFKGARKSGGSRERAPKARSSSGWTFLGLAHGLALGFVFGLFVHAEDLADRTEQTVDPAFLDALAISAMCLMLLTVFYLILAAFFRKTGGLKAFGFAVLGVLLMAASIRHSVVVPLEIVDISAHVR